MPAWAKSIAIRAAARLTGSAALCLSALLIAVTGPAAAQTSDLVSKNALRVCADPANYPMSTKEGTGYENKLADLIAAKLDLPVQYTWYPQATGFIRNTLKIKRCDIVMGYAQGHELVLNTNHYFSSVYTLIVPQDSDLASVETLTDPALQDTRIGIIAGTPPSAHLARHGLIGKAKPYNLVVDSRVESPATNMLDDLQSGDIDAAILWGPIGGPLVRTDYSGMKVIPLINEELPPRLFFRITMGVRQGEKVWQRELNSLIRRHQDEIDAILIEAGVPLVSDMGNEVLELAQ